jgi:hypothetical protein
MLTPICSSNVAYPLFSSLGICKLVLMFDMLDLVDISGH